ncbi:Aromatic prenyltransferase CloQ [Streptomyces sp. YIM 130001]|uniref:aromatic prenyltransferase n=1 Tax=Streptomyces sp. YIM 130001 TaxID=2259644 RepID=UPI000E6545AE|nr:aromatic prenyltransferase [Streptomyces sp. YIM 130001]RII13471.1 Aromatic prenyltransferase CloQ [Streptomyces sp. YIM 130001]
MSRTRLTELYAGVKDSAAILGVPVSQSRVLPVLGAYEDALDDALVAFRVATNKRHEGEFDCRFTVPRTIDPYARARTTGLYVESGHPAERVLADVEAVCPVDSYGVDFGVVGGFRKIWAYFPGDAYQKLSALCDLPSMPVSLTENFDFFAERGLDDKVDLIAVDYRSRTVNLYFADFPAELRRPDAVREVHRAVGLPEPSEQMTRFCANSFGFYATLSWDSPKVERISFSVKTHDPLALPGRLGPKIEMFARSVRYGLGDPKMVYAAMTASGEEYYKLQTYFRFESRSRLDLMPSADAVTPAI